MTRLSKRSTFGRAAETFSSSLLVLCTALLLVQNAQAQTTQDSNEARTQSEMNARAARDYRYADAGLNEAWTSAKSFADAIGQGDALLAAQRLWLDYRDAACEVHASPLTGGTLQPMALSNCLTSLTEERTRMLLEFHGY